MITLIVIALLLIGTGFFAAKTYNSLQTLLQQVRQTDSNVQVAVRKKLSLVNQMIDLVRNYQESEQFTQLKISQDGNDAMIRSAYQQSGSMWTSMQNIAERFPNLKANEQYNNLSNSISGCENDVQHYSMVYNNAATAYNTTFFQFPVVLFAKMMGFVAAPYASFDMSGVRDMTSLKEFKTADSDRLQNLLSEGGLQQTNSTGNSLSQQQGQTRPLINVHMKNAKNN